ncbi:MAG: four helix bundle protein [Phycisphaeraceae bacterium]
MATKRKFETHRDLEVYRKSFEAAMEVFEASKRFPPEERYSLTDQGRRSSRSVSANIAEAWRKRRYEAAFISKLSDAEAEAAETQVWIEYRVRCGYLDREAAKPVYQQYEDILKMIIAMINHPDVWIITPVESRA